MIDLEVFLGMIKAFPYPSLIPAGWALCDGRMLSTSQYSALYALIQNKFGGNSTNFALPKLYDPATNLNAAPLPGMRYYIAMEGIFPVQQ